MSGINLDIRNILVNHLAQNREDVIRSLGGLLLENNYVKDTFTEAVLDREIIFPTGLQTKTVGVAIPHTDTEHVIESTVAIATLTSPVVFMGMGYPDLEIPVSIVMMLAVSDKEKVMETLTKVISILENEATINKLVGASTEQEVQDAFLNHMNSITM